MSAPYGGLRKWLMVALLGCVVVWATGCGYLKNTRDDFKDCFILGAGVVVPVVPGEDENIAVGLLPPSLGIYLEATEFFHLGGIYKVSGDLEWDRRACGIVVDKRTKVGIGPLHYVDVEQWPIWVNDYKSEGNKMDGWREYMRDFKDPVFGRPAKELIFEKKYGALPFLHRGWQDWEVFSLEIAIPEPFILHSGFNVRAGVDPSQMFDFVLGVFCLDLYDDNAYRFFGALQHPGGEEE